MSRSAFLVSKASKEYIYLGKIVTRPNRSGVEETFFHIGQADEPSNSANPIFMKAIMKFLTQHMGDDVRVMAEEEFFEEVEVYSVIGGNIPPSLEEYTDGFEG